MQIWRLLKYQDVPPALKGFQDFVAPYTSLLDSHRHIPDENESEWKTAIWDDHDLEQDEEYWIEDDNDELITIPSSDLLTPTCKHYVILVIIIYARPIYSYMPISTDYLYNS